MESKIFEVIEVNKKFIKLKDIDKNIPIKSVPKDIELKKGDLVKGTEFGGNIIISEKADPNSQKKEEIKKSNEKNNSSKNTTNQGKEEDKGLLFYPFNFVSLGDEEEIEESRKPIKKGNYSGKIKCKLTNLTPISVGSEKSTEFIKFKNKFIIPASSLKGEIRNIIEVLTNSCIRNVKEKRLYKMIPENFRPCKNTKHLCFACRLFGSTGNDMEDMSISQKSYKGRVFFSDAVINKDANTLTLSLALGDPRVNEEAALKKFYIHSNKEIRGRKFFWHQKELFKKQELTRDFKIDNRAFMSTISCIDIGQEFNFEVHFENLTDEELGVLVYALELEEGLLHKFGRAKAYGFGSCEIKVEKILLDNNDKYKNFITSNNEELGFLENIKKKYIESTKKQVRELKTILSQINKVHLGYPKPFPDRKTLNKFKGKTLPNILEYK
ncbi:hypothetical protein KST26_03005 [Fusobacterium animalis]|uniref:RAMP superfamily CRISPR-associated protein n=1 Tax=Fusobacterium animalis TaxID=76859 RepID=UPI0030D5FF83